MQSAFPAGSTGYLYSVAPDSFRPVTNLSLGIPQFDQITTGEKKPAARNFWIVNYLGDNRGLLQREKLEVTLLHTHQDIFGLVRIFCIFERRVDVALYAKKLANQ